MLSVAREALRIPEAWQDKREDETFRGFFGAPLDVVTDLWNRVDVFIDDKAALPKHLLWALIFIKVYATEAVHCALVGWPDEKTFRKWTWYFLEKISLLKDDIIKLDNRFEQWDGSSLCLMSIDGTDCPVMEPWPFQPKWYSKKFNGPGVKYEVGVCIRTGSIVWINGPFFCSVNDSTIAKQGLIPLLTEDEGLEVDAGYMGHNKFKAPAVGLSSQQRKEKSIVRGRHENVNSRLKQFTVLNVPFRHITNEQDMMKKHGWCFTTISIVTQLKFEAGERLYNVKYSANYL
jgi:hypothetical protein